MDRCADWIDCLSASLRGVVLAATSTTKGVVEATSHAKLVPVPTQPASAVMRGGSRGAVAVCLVLSVDMHSVTVLRCSDAWLATAGSQW